jgi:hypothetical protein
MLFSFLCVQITVFYLEICYKNQTTQNDIKLTSEK